MLFLSYKKKYSLVLVSYADFTSVELTQRNCSNRRKENVVVIVAVVVIIAECLLNNTYKRAF